MQTFGVLYGVEKTKTDVGHFHIKKTQVAVLK